MPSCGPAEQKVPSGHRQGQRVANQVPCRERGVRDTRGRQKTVRPSTSPFFGCSSTRLLFSRREYDRSLGSPFRAPHAPGQHPQATATRPSQQAGSKHFWPNRTREPTSGHPRAHPDHLYERATHPRAGSQASYTGSGSGTDPFSSPFVQRATGHRRSDPTSGPWTSARSQYPQGGFQSAGAPPWTQSSGNGRRSSTADGRPTQDEAAAESGVMRALGASGLVGVIILVAAIGGNSRRTS